MEDKVERISPRFAILATNTGWDRGIFARIKIRGARSHRELALREEDCHSQGVFLSTKCNLGILLLVH